MIGSGCRDALDAILFILESRSQIRFLRFGEYVSQPGFSTRALRWRDGKDVEKLFFSSKSEREFDLPRKLLTRDYLETLIKGLIPGHALNLLSRIKTSGISRETHLAIAALCDCGEGDVTSEFVDLARIVLTSMGGDTPLPHGFILNSGNGLHLISNGLLYEQEDFHRFCGKLLLAGDFADTRYIGHKLLAGELSVRIAKKDPNGKIQIPQVLTSW